ncbi:hypothetical protein ABIA33_006811 [Streptacidiphilus sp. MAP12-16]|uniref:hypothetical protein n=1 Tax=Streptacidiphilus sp. MAP12-16 TaxID=3156300 RepID=UPI0035171729
MTQIQPSISISHELLERALDELPPPQGDVVAAVLAGVRTQRRRRRSGYTLASAACAAVAAGVITIAGSTGAGHATSVPQQTTQGTRSQIPYPLDRLLPANVTDVRRISDFAPTGSPTAPAVKMPALQGGIFSFTRHGQTGYLRLISYDKPHAPASEPLFALAGGACSKILPVDFQHGLTCRMTDLPHGATLEVLTQGPVGDKGWTTPSWEGPSYIAFVIYPDGREVLVSAMSSFGSSTKVTRTPPLTVAEVAAMATSPDWFAPLPTPSG